MFYLYPPEKVWQVLTNHQALAAWLMANHFESRLGHLSVIFQSLISYSNLERLLSESDIDRYTDIRL
ncbi:SRPBCC domain-containing protein [Nostoc sp. FACHB-888]|uniref:SRPBCC domain-containing protein n=1 Tax=Nostoc sp. FACHB-888 TaxID=2692842 RepID=UPI001F54DEF2|nr:SRPBCC domain-containing protein [Nostoc sp. FACHB-888]